MWPVKVRYAINALTPWYYRKMKRAHALRDQTARTAISRDACTAKQTTQQPVPNALTMNGQNLLLVNVSVLCNWKSLTRMASAIFALLMVVHLVSLIKATFVTSAKTHQLKLSTEGVGVLKG